MSQANNLNFVTSQYNTDRNLKVRVEFHQKFSVNKYGWSSWIFDQYKFKPNYHVVEFGCGNGELWEVNRKRIPNDIEIVLTDFSPGMIEITKNKLAGINQISRFTVMDIQNIDFSDSSLDVVIANHMLYHVPDRDLAIKEVSRVLKPEGTFYATTLGKGNMKELRELVLEFDPSISYGKNSVAKEFGLDNGKEQLLKHFDNVEVIYYEDSLRITEAEPLVNYLFSLGALNNFSEVMTESKTKAFNIYLEDIISRKGCIEVSKITGMFIARNPIKK
jgi:ubiquinone/menaquinone biosynthesis C-methylase UbiE